MGIGPVALQLYEDLTAIGEFKPGMSICELGSQDVIAPGLPEISSKAYMEEKGFTYWCIDIDGRHDALPIDLNTHKIKEHAFVRSDIITNHGTTEHVFNQANCFEIMHELCLTPGLMIHIVPTKGYDNHCFYLYKENIFRDLAIANDYEVIRLYEDNKIHKDVLLIVVFKKINDSSFKMPTQTRFTL